MRASKDTFSFASCRMHILSENCTSPRGLGWCQWCFDRPQIGFKSIERNPSRIWIRKLIDWLVNRPRKPEGCNHLGSILPPSRPPRAKGQAGLEFLRNKTSTEQSAKLAAWRQKTHLAGNHKAWLEGFRRLLQSSWMWEHSTKTRMPVGKGCVCRN